MSVILLPLLLASCSLIDDDLSVCGEEVVIHYDLQLYTELSVQLQAELDQVGAAPVRAALEQWLSPVFLPDSADVSLWFYTDATDEIAISRQEMLREQRTRFSITLPKESYRHIAVANTRNNSQMLLNHPAHSADMTLGYSAPDVVGSLHSAIYSARLPIEVVDSMGDITVLLSMVTSAVALSVDTAQCPSLVALNGYVLGGASRFAVYDSTFAYEGAPRVELEEVGIERKLSNRRQAGSVPAMKGDDMDASPYRCMAAVSMPTRDDTSWSIELTATLTGERHTTTLLTLNEPLQAGALRIITLQMNADGALTPISTTEVGATVALDWKKGDDHEVDL